tara:strand:- start:423 stop:707 length:285 start_codon:yes stop_codon:yes gene_type:complete
MSVVRIFNDAEETAEDENTTWSVDDVKDYVSQYMVYEQQIKDLQDSRREWSADFLKRKSIPKKELTQAVRVARQELDMDVVNEIYDNIVDLFVD